MSRKVLHTFAAMALFGSISLGVLAIRPPAPPKTLLASPSFYDFGVVRPSILKCSFTLKNNSARPVVVTRVYKSCGCTAVHCPAGRIDPGARILAPCEVNANGRAGPFSTHFRVIYRDIDDPTGAEKAVTCTMSANVDPIVHITPSEVDFTDGRSGDVDLVVTSADQPDVRCTAVKCDHPAIVGQLNKEGTKIRVTYDASIWHDGDRTIRLELETNCPTEKNISVPVHVGQKSTSVSSSSESERH